MYRVIGESKVAPQGSSAIAPFNIVVVFDNVMRRDCQGEFPGWLAPANPVSGFIAPVSRWSPEGRLRQPLSVAPEWNEGMRLWVLALEKSSDWNCPVA